jgi:hypothetical protein
MRREIRGKMAIQTLKIETIAIFVPLCEKN